MADLHKGDARILFRGIGDPKKALLSALESTKVPHPGVCAFLLAQPSMLTEIPSDRLERPASAQTGHLERRR